MPEPLDRSLPEVLHEAHPFVVATWRASASWNTTPDGRLAPWMEPGLIEVRVAPARLERALALMQAVIETSSSRGLTLRPAERSRGWRSGIEIGQAETFTGIRVEEQRRLVRFEDIDLDNWRRSTVWSYREQEFRQRGHVPRADERLRVRLPRRHRDWPVARTSGWRTSFTDEHGRPLELMIDAIVDELAERAGC